MSMNFDQRLQQARDAGGFMRVFNKPRGDVPKFEIGEEGRQLRRSWEEGWDAADAKLKRTAA